MIWLLPGLAIVLLARLAVRPPGPAGEGSGGTQAS
jgi:hypothetical protein